MGFRNYFADALDNVGSFFHLPELGISEAAAGGKRTVNTGNQAPARLNGKTNDITSRLLASNPNLFDAPAKSPGTFSQGDSVIQGPVAPQVDPEEAAMQHLLSILGQEGAASGTGGSGGGGAASAATGPTHSFQELGGKLFDLNDPAQAAAYYQAANADNFGIANANYDTATGNIARSRDNLKYNTDSALSHLQQERDQLKSDRENYFAGLERQGKDLVTGKKVGDANRQGYFSGLGANAFQSSQATSQDFAENKFAEALAQEQQAGADAGDKFDARAGSYDASQQDLLRQAGQDETDLAKQEADAKFTRDNYIGSNQGKVATALTQGAADAGLTDYASRYKVDPYSSVNTYQPDLSGVSKYTSFGVPAAPGAPEAAAGPGSALSGLRSKQTDPLSNYFGYAPDDATKSRIRNYFAGTAA